VTVEAAGGVVVRHGEGGPKVALVHRPKYNDWSHPKGKLDPGETFEQAAVREVLEETGMRCRPVRELGESHYEDRNGRPKVVRWWLMEVEDAGQFEPGREVDALRWVSPGKARELLTYERDRELLDAL
jgi:8-oxo-dGTP diphosphatase